MSRSTEAGPEAAPGGTLRASPTAKPRRFEGQEALAAIAGGLAHELNNLLSAVVMMVDLLRGSCAQGRDQDLLAAMDDSARRGVHLVRQMLWLASGVEDEVTLFQPRHLLLDALKMARAVLPASASLTGDFPPDLLLLRGDPFRLYRAFLDLCLEAKGHLAPGGEMALRAWNAELDQVSAALRPGLAAGSYVVLEITRSGAEATFPPLAASLFADFGGFAEAVPHAGGQLYRVYLRASRTPSEAAESETRAVQDGSGELVLVVEGDAAVRTALNNLLERHGYRTLAAADGAEAVALFARNGTETAAVIVTADLRFLDGPGVLRAIHHLRPGVPAVATGTSRQLAAWTAGPAAWTPLAKPFTASSLLTALREALQAPA